MAVAWTEGILWGGWGKFWGKTGISPGCSVEHVETEKFSPDSTLAGKVLGQMAVIFPNCLGFHTPKLAV